MFTPLGYETNKTVNRESGTANLALQGELQNFSLRSEGGTVSKGGGKVAGVIKKNVVAILQELGMVRRK